MDADALNAIALATKVTGSTVSPTNQAALLKASKDPQCIDAVAKTLAPYAEAARLLG
jgi:hypothetical protein